MSDHFIEANSVSFGIDETNRVVLRFDFPTEQGALVQFTPEGAREAAAKLIELAGYAENGEPPPQMQ